MLNDRDSRLVTIVVPHLPASYKLTTIRRNQIGGTVVIGSVRGSDAFAMFLVNNSTVALKKGYLSPWVLFPKVETTIANGLGRGYVKHELSDGAIFTAKDQPSVELLFTKGAYPSEVFGSPSYRLFVMVFPPRITPLQLFYPCGLWSFPSPTPSPPVSHRDCYERWEPVEIQ